MWVLKEMIVLPLKSYPDLKKYPDYRELYENYHAEEKRLNQYRLDSKQEFFELFGPRFYDLWN